MFKGDIHSEYTLLDDFVEDNWFLLKEMFDQTDQYVDKKDFSQGDDYLLARYCMVASAVCADQTEIEVPIPFESENMDKIAELTTILFVKHVIEHSKCWKEVK
jgi:hypothetical protein